jgi:acyl carrier protein
MKTNKNEIKSRLNSIIADIIESERADFDESSRLIDDLEFDSMCYLELSVQIQREYGVIISAADWESIKTLNELYDVIISKLETNGQD